MLPGVPHECRYLTDHALLPYLQARQEGVIYLTPCTFSALTEPKGPGSCWTTSWTLPKPQPGSYAKAAEVQLRITAKAEIGKCADLLAPLLAEVRRLSEHIYAAWIWEIRRSAL